MQSDGDKDKFAAAVTHGEYAGSMKDLINLAQNLDCYWLYPTVRSEEDYGYYLMKDWVARLDAFLQFNEEEVLHHKGKVTAAIAKSLCRE